MSACPSSQFGEVCSLLGSHAVFWAFDIAEKPVGSITLEYQQIGGLSPAELVWDSPFHEFGHVRKLTKDLQKCLELFRVFLKRVLLNETGKSEFIIQVDRATALKKVIFGFVGS